MSPAEPRGGELPAATRRLFPEWQGLPLDLTDHAPYILARVLEDGDRRDLAWLVRTYGRPRLVDWVKERGDRQLSGRSRSFWHRVLDLAPSPETPGGSTGSAGSTGDAGDAGDADASYLWPLR